MQPKDHSKGRARDITVAPGSPPDDRCLAWELKRPILAPGLSVNQIAGIDVIVGDAGLAQAVATIPDEIKKELATLPLCSTVAQRHLRGNQSHHHRRPRVQHSSLHHGRFGAEPGVHTLSRQGRRSKSDPYLYNFSSTLQPHITHTVHG